MRKFLRRQGFRAAAWLGLAVMFLIMGCAAGPQGVPDQPAPTVPPECKDAWVYKVPEFMPGGPIVLRTGVALFTTAQPQYTGAVKAAAIAAYKAVLAGNLAGALGGLMAAFKVEGAARYAQPVLVMLESLAQAGVIQGQPGMVLTDCDKNVLGSLFKNIALDAGALPADFQ